MNISRINFAKITFGINIGPKLEDEMTLKRLHIQSLPNSRRHISLDEYDRIIAEIKKLFPKKYGSITTVEIVERIVPNVLDNGTEYFYSGEKEITGYEIKNNNGNFKHFFERQHDGKEHFDKYRTLINELRKLDREANIEKKKWQKIPNKLKPFFVNPKIIERKLRVEGY